MSSLRCQICERELPPGGLKYVVEIRSFADFDGFLEEYDEDIEESIDELLEAMEEMDPQTLEEDVYMKHSYILCKSCRDRFMREPFGKGVTLRESQRSTIH